jgi:hypothetical protein
MSLSSHWDSGRNQKRKEIDLTSLDRTREKERLMSFGRKENVSNSYCILHYVDKNNCSLSEKQSITRQINKVPMKSTHPDCRSSKAAVPRRKSKEQKDSRQYRGSTATLLHWIKTFGPSSRNVWWFDAMNSWIPSVRPRTKTSYTTFCLITVVHAASIFDSPLLLLEYAQVNEGGNRGPPPPSPFATSFTPSRQINHSWTNDLLDCTMKQVSREETRRPSTVSATVGSFFWWVLISCLQAQP